MHCKYNFFIQSSGSGQLGCLSDNIPLYIVYTTSLSIHLLMDSQGCFHILAIVNNAAGYTHLFQLWFSQGICPVVRFLGHILVLLLAFKESPFSCPDQYVLHTDIVAASIYIPTNRRQFPFLQNLSRIYCLQIFDDGHSDRFEAISHWSFYLYFSNNEQC